MNTEKTTQKTELAQPDYTEAWHEVGQQAQSLAESLASALQLSFENIGHEVLHETRPQLLTTLQRVRDEVQKMISRLEQPQPPVETDPEAKTK